MPRDQRLWMTFPIDFWMHPKVAPLSDAAFRTFVEMNGYSRQQRLDGVIPQAVAQRMWDRGAVDELLGSDPHRPLVLHTDQAFVIRDYADHQETVADEEARRERNRANGAKGGRPRKNPQETQPVTEPVTNGYPPGTPGQTHTKAESESEDYYLRTKSQSRSNRARVSTDSIPISAMTKRLAAQKGISNLRAVVDAIGRHTSCTVTADQAFQLCTHLLDKAKSYPDEPQRYVLVCIERSAAEVEKHLYEQIGVAS